jgi:hypothetical protein
MYGIIRHDVVGWKPIDNQEAARAMPLERVRRRAVKPVVVGRRPLPPGAGARG